MSRISVASSLAIILLVGLTAGAQSSERGVAAPTVDRPITNYFQIIGVAPQESPNFPKSSSQLPTKARAGTNEFYGLYLDGDKPGDVGYSDGAENCFTVPAISGDPPTGFYYLFDNVTNDDASFDGFVDLGYLYCGEDPPQGTDPLDLMTTDVINVSFVYQVIWSRVRPYDWLVMSCETPDTGTVLLVRLRVGGLCCHRLLSDDHSKDPGLEPQPLLHTRQLAPLVAEVPVHPSS